MGLRASTSAVILALIAVGAGGSIPAATPTAAVDRAAAGVDVPSGEPRVAFTAERAALVSIALTRTGDEDGSVFDIGAGNVFSSMSEYEAEASSGGGRPRMTAFVSARDGNGPGEVYVARGSDDQRAAPRSVRITCDGAPHSHPVVSPDGARIAYATGHDDGWVIEVAGIPADERDDCAVVSRSTVATSGHDIVWPSWVDSSHLVVSSTRDDPRGELYLVSVPEDGPVGPLVRLTTDDGADTQPASVVADVGDGVLERWVAFRTTRFRSDGSVALLRLPDPDRALDGQLAVVDPWRGSAPQGGEPSWGDSAGLLAFTRTDRDAAGDVWIAELDRDICPTGEAVTTPDEGGHAGDEPLVAEFPEGPALVGPGVDRGPAVLADRAVAAVEGVAESHPTWQDTVCPAASDETGTVVYTRRTTADVASVPISGGSDRRVVVATTSDGEAQDDRSPTYSPDGTQLVVSSSVADPDPDGSVPGVALMVAAADGSWARRVDYQRAPGDRDTEPAWSPDGRYVAFVRAQQGPTAPGRVHVLELATGEVRKVDTGGDGADASPSWSPDSQWLVYTQGGAGRLPTVRTIDLVQGESGPLEADVEECEDRCLVLGLAPAWSPDGSRIALASPELTPVDDEGGAVATYPGAIVLLALDLVAGEDGRPEPTVDGLTPVTGPGVAGGEDGSTGKAIAVADHPAWSPDGHEIFFAGRRAGDADRGLIGAVADDGTGLRRVGVGPGPESEPAVQPWPGVAVSLTATPGQVAPGGSATLAVSVTNAGPAPAPGVTLRVGVPAGLVLGEGPPVGCVLDASDLRCDLGDLAVGGAASVSAIVEGLEAGRHEATAVVAASTPERDTDDNSATATVEVQPENVDLSVQVALSTPVAWVGGAPVTATFTVSNLAGVAVDDVTLTATVSDLVSMQGSAPCTSASASCTLGTVAAGDTVELVASLVPVGADATAVDPEVVSSEKGEVTAVVATATPEADVSNNSASAEIEVRRPSLRMLPSIARPGQVVLAYGDGYPPGVPISLTWTRGTTVIARPVAADGDGSVRAQVLVVENDLLGQRSLRASSPSGGPPAFGPVEAPGLILHKSMDAPSLIERG